MNRIKNAKPLPCPFCGSTKVELKYCIMDSGLKVHRVLCHNCLGSGGIDVNEKSALAKWNHRSEREVTNADSN